MQTNTSGNPLEPYDVEGTGNVTEIATLTRAARGGDPRARATLTMLRERRTEEAGAQRETEHRQRVADGRTLADEMEAVRRRRGITDDDTTKDDKDSDSRKPPAGGAGWGQPNPTSSAAGEDSRSPQPCRCTICRSRRPLAAYSP